MALVSFTQHLLQHLDCPDLQVAGNTLGEAMQAVFQANPKLKSYLMTDQNQFRQHILVALDGDILISKDLATPINPSSKIQLFQALSGG